MMNPDLLSERGFLSLRSVAGPSLEAWERMTRDEKIREFRRQAALLREFAEDRESNALYLERHLDENR